VTTAESLLRLARTGTPLITDQTATFVWQGDQAPQLIGDFCGWQWGTPVDLDQVAPGVWTQTLSLPADAYVEYSYWRDGQRVADPFSRRTVPDGLGHTNHFFYMPEAAPSSLVRRGRGVPRGTVTRHVLEHEFLLGGRGRTVLFYQPPTTEPAPLLVVLDGQDYFPRGRLVQIVDNLIAQRRIRPVALAMVYHGGRLRGIEYACSEAHMGALLHLLPLAKKELNLLDWSEHPSAYGIMGASMGGLMALFVGLRLPHIFGKVLSQSGAFEIDWYETVVLDLVRHGPLRPLRIWMDVGRLEWLLEPNRAMHRVLVEKGYDVAYREFSGGHNYTSWRNDLWRGLEALFGRR
jgi:enterochelin esterase-like enzyme